MRGGGIEIDVSATVIEEDADVRITEGGFDNSGVERGAADRVDVVARIAVVRRKMELRSRACGMDHTAGHRDRVLENFVRNTELLEGMNPAGGEREIN